MTVARAARIIETMITVAVEAVATLSDATTGRGSLGKRGHQRDCPRGDGRRLRRPGWWINRAGFSQGDTTQNSRPRSQAAIPYRLFENHRGPDMLGRRPGATVGSAGLGFCWVICLSAATRSKASSAGDVRQPLATWSTSRNWVLCCAARDMAGVDRPEAEYRRRGD